MKKKTIPLSEIDIGKVSVRFWTKVQKVGECLEWQGGCCKDGYGKFTIFHKTYRAHRLAFFLYYGIDPGRELVLHKCDNPACVNPQHLFRGDQKANIQDMDVKGRRGNMSRQGAAHPRAILTEQDVLQIRRSDKSIRQIAYEYGVSPGCIHHARSGMNWSHL